MSNAEIRIKGKLGVLSIPNDYDTRKSRTDQIVIEYRIWQRIEVAS